MVNLVTTNESYTPKLKSLKVLYHSNVEHGEDYVWRSFSQFLRNNVRPITDIVFTADGSSSYDLDDYLPRTPYNIVDVDSVFDNTNDSDHLTDLLDTYVAGTKVLTLSSPVADGDVVWIRVLYEPEVAVTTSREYSELGTVPAITIENIKELASSESGLDDSVINKSTGQGWKVPSPKQKDIELVLRLITDKAKDQTRLSDEVQRVLGSNQLLTSVALDEQFRLWLIDEYAQRGVTGGEETHSGTLRVRIVGALFYERPAQAVYSISRLVLGGDVDVTVT